MDGSAAQPIVGLPLAHVVDSLVAARPRGRWLCWREVSGSLVSADSSLTFGSTKEDGSE